MLAIYLSRMTMMKLFEMYARSLASLSQIILRSNSEIAKLRKIEKIKKVKKPFPQIITNHLSASLRGASVLHREVQVAKTKAFRLFLIGEVYQIQEHLPCHLQHKTTYLTNPQDRRY
ncbi:hypothetical protein AVEN_261697-1 [Araneus ventricosus]|uniref:Uncharacterized protein n=1 Tax=Araneus ventricosus TaxID=182803 RepID=A0A4Y2DY51_ARAVE|nr:hypothetical protein AVEN_261697-1 [Araneus ventricosus]